MELNPGLRVIQNRGAARRRQIDPPEIDDVAIVNILIQTAHAPHQSRLTLPWGVLAFPTISTSPPGDLCGPISQGGSCIGIPYHFNSCTAVGSVVSIGFPPCFHCGGEGGALEEDRRRALYWFSALFCFYSNTRIEQRRWRSAAVQCGVVAQKWHART